MTSQIVKLEPIKKFLIAATPNQLVNTPNEKGTVSGFWHGVWHGFIFPIAFFMSLFNKRIGVYESHNNGGWYNFGFLLGLSMSLGGKKVSVKVNGRKRTE